jgi:hypothetical protein
MAEMGYVEYVPHVREFGYGSFARIVCCSWVWYNLLQRICGIIFTSTFVLICDSCKCLNYDESWCSLG